MMPSPRTVILSFSLLLAAACVSQDALPPAPVTTRPDLHPRDPTVETRDGLVIGQIDANGVTSFLGVPYATPPIGDTRWASPAPPRPHPPLEARSFRLPCSQIPIPSGSDSLGAGQKIPSSEDCLYLNIWVPPHVADERLPVMLWSHGGQYLRGAASQYDGDQLARLGRVVVITLGYRLGPLGFLAHPALTAESQGTSGNQALLDHIQALTWVHANIARFGGDPGRITLFGESAGSATACALMASPRARGLFHRSILQSGPCVGEIPTLAEREAFGRRLAEALGCGDEDPRRELACMRSRPVDAVMTAIPLAKVLGEDGEGVGYRFNRDDTVLLAAPADALAAGDVAPIPVLLGTVDDEMGRYVGGFGVNTAEGYRVLLTDEWGDDAARLLAAYPVGPDVEARPRLAALYSDWVMSCPVRRNARALAAAGTPTYLYRFRRVPNIWGREAGSFHGADIVYLFPSVFKRHGLVLDDDDDVFAKLMIGYWSRFAATGDPNGADAPTWPRYDSGDRHLELDVEARTGVGLRRAECDLWDAIGE